LKKKPSSEKTEVATKSIVSSIFEKKETAVTNTASAADDVITEPDGDKVTITKVFDFAGEAVEYVNKLSLIQFKKNPLL
jgi:hypothetical protein